MNPWQQEPWKPAYGGQMWQELDGTAAALSRALGQVPADATLSLGGDPIDSEGTGIWYCPRMNQVTIL